MNRAFRQKLLQYLATTSIALTSGVGAINLEEIPTPVALEVIDDADDDRWTAEDRQQLLEVFAVDPRPTVRSRVVQGLTHLLATSTSIERIAILREWATAADEARRLILAEALAQPLPSLATDTAVWTLADDELATVRRAAVRAAEGQYSLAPRLYRRVLVRLSADADDAVQAAARQALRGCLLP